MHNAAMTLAPFIHSFIRFYTSIVFSTTRAESTILCSMAVMHPPTSRSAVHAKRAYSLDTKCSFADLTEAHSRVLQILHPRNCLAFNESDLTPVLDGLQVKLISMALVILPLFFTRQYICFWLI